MLGQYPLSSHGKRRIKPLLECAAALKNGGEEEVEEGPEFRSLFCSGVPVRRILLWGPRVRVEDLESACSGDSFSFGGLRPLSCISTGSVTQEEAPTCGERGKTQVSPRGQCWCGKPQRAHAWSRLWHKRLSTVLFPIPTATTHHVTMGWNDRMWSLITFSQRRQLGPRKKQLGQD